MDSNLNTITLAKKSEREHTAKILIYWKCKYTNEKSQCRKLDKTSACCALIPVHSIIIVMIIIIAFKGAVRDFFNRIQRRCSRFFQSPHSTTNCLQYVRSSCQGAIVCNTSSTYHVQVSCYMPLGTKGQLSYWLSQSLNRIYFSSILLAETTEPMKEGRKLEYLEKTPGDKLQKMPHTKPEDSSPKRDSNPRNLEPTQ